MKDSSTTWLTSLARPEIAAMAPYRPASWEPTLVRLHANEMPWSGGSDGSGEGLNRYPEPYHDALDDDLAAFFGVDRGAAFATRGSDEGIDLLVRAFCRAGHDSVLVCPPTFGMYAAAAHIQGASVVSVPLVRDASAGASAGFRLDVEGVLAACSPSVKLVFLCSPNNPTGNLLDGAAVDEIVNRLSYRALVVIDEAYVEFAGTESYAARLRANSNVVVLRTFSKARALAGVRVGVILAAREVIDLARKVCPPYALPQLSIDAVRAAISETAVVAMHARLDTIREERARVAEELRASPKVVRVWPSDANFLLCEVVDAASAMSAARGAALLVRDFSTSTGLSNCIRVTIGTREQNDRLVEAWS